MTPFSTKDIASISSVGTPAGAALGWVATVGVSVEDVSTQPDGNDLTCQNHLMLK